MKGIAIHFILIGVSTLVFLTPSLVVEAQRTVTRTQTTTVFSTTVVQSNFVCAKLVNVTGQCRRGRGGILMDVSVFLTFDEELEHSIDEAFNQLVHQQFIPSRTLSVEVTPLTFLPTSHLQNQVGTRYFSGNQLHLSPSPTPYAIQSSQELSARFPGRNKVGAEGNKPQPRIYFSQVNSIFNRIIDNLGIRPAVTVTVTDVITQTTTITAGSATASFFVMGCTPNPFRFAICASEARSIVS